MLLQMLKVDLGITTTAYDARLQQYIDAANTEIGREGITLNLENVGDMQLVVMYAAWRWRNRDNMVGMPRMLRVALNNRVFAEKART